MKPFQVNCSDLIADFNIHEDKEIRDILIFLTSEYDVELYFETNVGQKEFFFNKNFTFHTEIEDIKFVITVTTHKFYEYWTARLLDKKDIGKLINGIEKINANKYGEETEFASNYIARQLNNHIITQLPNYHSEIENGLINQINIVEIFDVDIKVGSETNETTLCYGDNGYDILGWYFDAEHYDQRAYPFYEWAQKNCSAKIKPYDGGNSFGYHEYIENPDRERLRKKL